MRPEMALPAALRRCRETASMGLPKTPPEHDHAVKFYDEDQTLINVVAEFLVSGLGAGSYALACLTRPHARSLLDRLASLNQPVDALLADGRLVLLDARQTLDGFMCADLPDQQQFNNLIGPIMQQAPAGTHWCVFGEMVDLLARKGRMQAAIALEQCWNDLFSRQSFALLCGYSLTSFATHSERQAFEAVCCNHSHVAPVGASGPWEGNAAQALEITHLQFQVQSLRSETPERPVEPSDYVTVRNALEGALERDEFTLNYQPQICQSSGRLVGVEALLRWQSASLGRVPPARFIPVAECSGFMTAIGTWVLQQACRQARAWLQQGLRLRMAVNVCSRQLEARNFPSLVRGILAANALPPELLEIELTEGTLMQHSESTLGNLKALRGMGVRIAIDDFGTGYSSLAYLKHFNFDTLKIDRLFTSELGANDADSVLVRAILAIGREMGLTVLAEGVETEAQRDLLAGLGCSSMQGYLFGRPMPAAELEGLLSRETLPWATSVGKPERCGSGFAIG